MFRPTAFSYVRFSTPEQLRGDSYRRQVTAAREYADKHGLNLDESLGLNDLGLSAFRGANSESGKLGDFLTLVRAGQIPKGSFLLVESLDRLSRQSARKALRTLEDIIEGGVSVVTLFDGRIYDVKSLEGTDLLIALLLMIRANEESATKARRLRHAWDQKRLRAQSENGAQRLTSIAPGWLSAEGEGFKVIEEAANVVREIFRLALDGTGRQAIAAILNERGTKPFSSLDTTSRRAVASKWHASYVGKILTNPAVIGSMIPHTETYVNGKTVREALEPIEHYFPAVIESDVWAAVQALRSSRKPRVTQSDGSRRNPLGGLLRCQCNRPVTRASKGRGPNGQEWAYYVCVGSRERGELRCRFPQIRASQLEDVIWTALPSILKQCPSDGERSKQLVWEIGGIAGLLAVKENSLGELVKELERGESYSPAVRSRIDNIEAEIANLRSKVRALRFELDAIAPGLSQRRAIALADSMSAGTAALEDVNSVCRAVFLHARFDLMERLIVFHWRQGGAAALPLPKFTRAPRISAQSRHPDGKFR